MAICELPNDIEALKHLVLETHQQVVDRDEQLVDRDVILADRDAQLADRDVLLADRDELLADRDVLLADRDEQLAERNEQLAAHREEIEDNESRIKELESQLAYLKHRLFGQRSEKIDPAQLLLFNQLTAEVEALQEEAEQEEITYTRRKGHGRKALPDDLPVEDVVYPLENTDCPCCGEAMRGIGDEVTEELEYHPGSLFKRRHIRPKVTLQPFAACAVALAVVTPRRGCLRIAQHFSAGDRCGASRESRRDG